MHKKRKNNTFPKKFNFILQNLSVDDKLGHLLVVDISFNKKKKWQIEKHEKKKVIKPYERSILQLQSVLLKNQNGNLKTFKFNEKTHSTMKKNIFLSLYVHYTSRFKRDFVIMKQVSRQKAQTKVEKDFYKLMNNSNFGNDCRNNIDNSNFKAIYDEIEEISYIQRYISIYFNDDYKDFACPETIKRQIEQEYNNKIISIKEDNPCAEAKRYCAGQKRNKKMHAVQSMISRSKRKKNFRDSEQKTTSFKKSKHKNDY